MPAMRAVGVASPMAQGQEMTSTAIMRRSPAWKGSAATKYHPAKTRNASTITEGTNRSETLSTRFSIGALFAWASSTIVMIWYRRVFLPTFVALNLKNPSWFTVAPITSSPAVFPTGKDSPVTTFSSIWVLPSVMTPSTGIFSPGRTRITSPSLSSSTGTDSSLPFRSTCASLASSFRSSLMADDAFPFALASRYRPRIMKERSAAEDSQNGWSMLKKRKPNIE